MLTKTIEASWLTFIRFLRNFLDRWEKRQREAMRRLDRQELRLDQHATYLTYLEHHMQYDALAEAICVVEGVADEIGGMTPELELVLERLSDTAEGYGFYEG